ncbi:hypothetical protein BS78_03G143100 [Paspalum vaginatum]|nr:hypothetical protein BS78_03G143100 [Paspalum vaginatum]
MDWQGNHVTSFLTSASLARALIMRTATKDYMNLKIEVRHEGNKVHEAFLAEADFGHNFAVVDVRTLLDVEIGFQHVQEIPPHDDDVLLVALGRDIRGKLITKTMKLRDHSTVSDDGEELHDAILEGGPLFSLDGHFVGMILRLNSRVGSIQPWNTILENLKQQLPHLLECVQV